MVFSESIAHMQINWPRYEIYLDIVSFVDAPAIGLRRLVRIGGIAGAAGFGTQME